MIISHGTHSRHCKEIGKSVQVTVRMRLPMQRGLGGMLRPKMGGFTEIICENHESCLKAMRNCVWALGSLKSKNDPIDMKISV